jgi:hypothetical protein
MENSRLDAIQKKIVALIKKRDSAEELGSLAEAEAFAAKIQDLSLKYGIEISSLDMDDQTRMNNPQGKDIDLTQYMRRHESDWIMKLFSATARGNMCEIITNRQRTWVDIIGMPHNIEIAIYMAESLIPRLRDLAKKEFKTYVGHEKRNTFIRGFLSGAVQAIAIRLRDNIEKAAQGDSQVSGLVKRTDLAVKDAFRKKYPNCGTSSSKRLSGYGGREAGAAAGKRIGLNKGINSGSAAASRLLS